MSIINAQQKCEVKGIVVDSLENGIENVSLIAFDLSGNVDSFVFTDKSGRFKMQLQCGEVFDIQFEHIDYNSLVFPLSVKKVETDEKRFVLEKSYNSLDEVLIEARVPIRVKGDIIEFDAESFKVGNEENLEDVLKNLPGIQVDNGKVYYQGKEIKNITIEGREIFGGNTKLINKNLPSNAVNTIQLNKKFKNNPFANSLQEDEDFALNIVLKDNKKSLVFGNTTVGTNFKEHSNLQGKAFYFNPSVDATLIGDVNTYGKEIFTRDDFMGFMGGISELRREDGKFSLRSNVQPIQLGTLEEASQVRTAISAGHIGYEPNNKWYVNGFILGTLNSLEYDTSNDRIFDNNTIRQENNESQELSSGLAQIRVDYFPLGNSELKYRANINFQDNEVNQLVKNFFKTLESSNTVEEQKMNISRTFLNFSHNFSYLTKVRQNDNFGLYISHNYQRDTPHHIIEAENPIFNNVFSNQTEENGVYNLKQKQSHKINTLQLYSVYNYLITNTTNLKTKLGSNFSAQKLENEVFSNELLLTGVQQETNAKLLYKEYYVDLNLTQMFGKLKLNFGGNLNKYKDINTIFDNEGTVIDDTAFLPYFKAKYEWSTSRSIALSYNKTFSYPEIKELSNTYQIQDTYTVFSGNSNLNREIKHDLRLKYNFSKFISFFNFYSELAFNMRENSFQTISSFVSLTQLNSISNSLEDANTYSASIYMDKKINRNYAIKLKGDFSINNFYTLTSTDFDNPSEFDLIKNTLVNHNYLLTNNFKIKKKLEVNLGLGYSNSNYETTSESSLFNVINRIESWRPLADIAWMINDKFLFQTSYSYENQTNNGEALNKYNDLDLSLRYKLFKKTYITLTGGNLIDNQLVRNSFNTNYTQITTRNRLGPYYLMDLKYKF